MKGINKNIFIFIFGILLVAGCNNNEEIPKKVELPQKNTDKEIYDSASIDGEGIKIIVRNASYPIKDPGGNSLSENYQLRERQMEIPLSQTALILIDTWDTENQRFQNSRKINIAKKIKPLLKIARELDMLVLYAPHRPIGWDGINHNVRKLDLRGPSDTPRSELPKWIKKIPKDQWPPIDFIFRVGKFSQYSKFSNPSYIPYTKILGIHKDLLPVKRNKEFIESSISNIQKIFRENGILHLLYVGGATNQCIVDRPVGIRKMSSRGYNTIIVRGATVGSELNNTYQSQQVTKSAILDIEINNGFSVSIDNLLIALESIKTFQ